MSHLKRFTTLVPAPVAVTPVLPAPVAAPVAVTPAVAARPVRILAQNAGDDPYAMTFDYYERNLKPYLDDFYPSEVPRSVVPTVVPTPPTAAPAVVPTTVATAGPLPGKKKGNKPATAASSPTAALSSSPTAASSSSPLPFASPSSAFSPLPRPAVTFASRAGAELSTSIKAIPPFGWRPDQIDEFIKYIETNHLRYAGEPDSENYVEQMKQYFNNPLVQQAFGLPPVTFEGGISEESSA